MSNLDISKLLECESLNCDDAYVTYETRQSEAKNNYVVNNNPNNLEQRGNFEDVKNIAIDTNYLNYSDGYGVNNSVLDQEREIFNNLTTCKGPHQLFLRTFVSNPNILDPNTKIFSSSEEPWTNQTNPNKSAGHRISTNVDTENRLRYKVGSSGQQSKNYQHKPWRYLNSCIAADNRCKDSKVENSKGLCKREGTKLAEQVTSIPFSGVNGAMYQFSNDLVDDDTILFNRSTYQNNFYNFVNNNNLPRFGHCKQSDIDRTVVPNENTEIMSRMGKVANIHMDRETPCRYSSVDNNRYECSNPNIQNLENVFNL